MSRRLLRLYPAEFRRDFGDEIAEAHREATEGAGRLARLREGCDIVAHALRLRLRVFGARSAFAGVAGTSACLLVASLPGALEMPLEHAAYLLPPLVIAALPLLCPADLRPARRIDSAAGLVALLVWAPLSVVVLALLDAGGLAMFPLWRFAVPVAAVLALAGRPALSGVRTAGRFALAVAPFLVLGHFCGVVGEANAVPCLVLLGAMGLAVGCLLYGRA